MKNNTGDSNSGYCNSGNRNAGNYNSGYWNTGYFNTDEPTIRMFNKDTGLKVGDIYVPCINLKLTEWIPKENMTNEQKENDPNFHIKEGTLITRSYKEAWQLAWKEMNEETKQKFLALPNFDADIFEEITGVKVNKENNCNGKVIEIEGKKYKLTEIKEV